MFPVPLRHILKTKAVIRSRRILSGFVIGPPEVRYVPAAFRAAPSPVFGFDDRSPPEIDDAKRIRPESSSECGKKEIQNIVVRFTARRKDPHGIRLKPKQTQEPMNFPADFEGGSPYNSNLRSGSIGGGSEAADQGQGREGCCILLHRQISTQGVFEGFPDISTQGAQRSLHREGLRSPPFIRAPGGLCIRRCGAGLLGSVDDIRQAQFELTGNPFRMTAPVGTASAGGPRQNTVYSQKRAYHSLDSIHESFKSFGGG